MTDQTSAPKEGWYTDPHDAAQLRWWDGSSWTDHVHTPAAAAEPATEAQPAVTPQPAAAQAEPVAQAPAAATPTPAATTSSQSQSQTSPGGIVSNPAPASGGKSGGSPIAQWFSVRSNQALFAILVIAIILFVFVMVGGAS